MILRPLLPLVTALAALAGPARADYSLLLRQGDMLDAQRRTAEALEVYRQAEHLRPDQAEVLHRISKQLGETIQDTTDATRRQALAEQALAYARRAVVADPTNANAQVSVAICLGLLTPFQGNKEKIAASKLIQTHTRRALELDPDNEIAHYVMGAWHYGLASLNPVLAGVARVIYGSLPPASHEEAIRSFRRALALNPGRAASWLGLGRALAEAGQNKEARTALERAIALPVRYKDDTATKTKAREALDDLE
jgi:tetratricopeptide (TPR) repeat protein